MVLEPSPRRLANLLIQSLKKKFEHELNSKIYQVNTLFIEKIKRFNIIFKKAAAILKVSGLKLWAGKPWSDNLFIKSMQSLKSVSENLLKKESLVQSNSIPNSTQSNVRNGQATPSDVFQRAFFSEEHDLPVSSLPSELFNLELIEEIKKFKAFLTANNNEVILTTINSREFWYRNQENFPKLSELAKILLNISSSSAFVERFFSICGIVNKKNCQNITVDLFTTRCFLKANMKILNELTSQNNSE